MVSSGGTLKPVKCFYHLISFKWNSDEKRQYVADEKDEEFVIGVPTP